MTCKDCTKRHAGCHSTCDDYKQYKIELKEKQDKIYKNRRNEHMMISVERNRYKK